MSGRGFTGGGVGGIGGGDTDVVGTDSLVNVAPKMVEQVPQQQTSIGRQHLVIQRIQVQFFWRPETRRKKFVIARVLQIKQMSVTQRLARDLPCSDGVVAHQDAPARAAENDGGPPRAVFPGSLA